MFDLKKVYGAHVGSGQCFVVRLAFVHQVSYLFSRVITNVKNDRRNSRGTLQQKENKRRQTES